MSGTRFSFNCSARLAAAVAGVLMAVPLAVSGASFPQYPLQTGASSVPPNILFILDDSGSMGFLTMPDDRVRGELADLIVQRSSTHNTIYYDPAIRYDPWMTATGTRMTGGTSFGAAFSDYDNASGDTINLASASSCRNHIQNGTSRTVCGGPTQATYYVLKAGLTPNASDNTRYFRYQIRQVGTSVRVVRSEWRGEASSRLFNTELSRGCADPDDSDSAWRNCVFATPTGRSEAAEIENFATWFSYHRSRMKMAKAGASEAFGLLGTNVRVGYRTIWDRGNFDIPVQDGNSGLFEDASASGRTTTSRSEWFRLVANANSSGSTPLQGALQRAGDYFSRADATGPYGPEAAASQLQCRQNFTILTTDGYWRTDPKFDANRVGEQDNTAGPSILNPVDGTNKVRYTPALPYSSPDSNTLGDIAMRYWKTDLRPDLDNRVPSSAANPAFWQHMVTFGISIGQKGTLDQQSVAEVMRDGSPRRNGVNVPWPTPGHGKTGENIDDLLHAAVNSRGEFIAASNAKAFGDALNGVLGQIQARLASGSNVSTNSTSFQSDTRMYQATYTSGQWSGDLVARDVTALGGISATEAWRVSTQISLSMSDADTRNDFDRRTVLTWNTANRRGEAFPTTAQTTLLARTTGAAVVTGADNAAYIKGRQALEKRNGGPLRNRSVLLGDIVNSSPFYVADTQTLYVGANDGMLHAINALNGQVLYSYVPAGIDFTKLATLSDPNYQHAFFVDGPVAVSSQSTANANYLVGALGRGGKGVFALNVTNPAGPAALWDHTAAADADMGYVLGTPLIAKGNNNTMLAIVANGIDSASGVAALYVYNLTTGTQLAKLTVGTVGGNGLSAPRGADIDGDGLVDFVYAGDLKGNLWKFDLTGTDPRAWTTALSGRPLFQTGTGQPITGGLAIAREPGSRRLWITFGTGSLITTSDLSTTTTQSLYAIIDGETPVAGRTSLTQRRIAAVGTDSRGRSVRAFEQYATLPTGSRGWYIDLGVPKPGERMVSGPRVRGRAAFYSTVVPESGNGCEPGGTGYLNVLDLFTGTSPQASGGGGKSTSFFDFDGDGTGDDEVIRGSTGDLPIGSVDFGIGMPTESGQIDNVVLVCGSGGQCEDPRTTAVGGTPRRVGWREILRSN